jgi:hypothetical protein
MLNAPSQFTKDWRRDDYTAQDYAKDWAPTPRSILHQNYTLYRIRHMNWPLIGVWAGCLAGCLLVWWAVIRMAI